MKIADFAGKNVCVLGYGREGKAVVAALETYAPTCEITVADKNEELKMDPSSSASGGLRGAGNGELNDTKHWLQVGSGWLHNLEKFDVVIKSPGIPPKNLQLATCNLLTNSTQIFLDSIADRNATVIGVTGSKGKSTTSSLIYSILKAAGRDTRLYGNIGEPAIAHLNDVKKGTIVVMEMSSYQLNDLTTSPHIAVITSFFPEHLDWHGSLDAYRSAKANIARFQKPDDIIFFAANKAAAELAMEGDGRKVPFSDADCPIDITDTKLIGDHNRSNIAAACMVAASLGIDDNITLKAVKEFEPLPHRLQSIGHFHDLDWVDDAISTTPESTIAALDALGDNVKTIILGGQDRGYDFSGLATRIASSNIGHVILFPGSGPRIREALESAKAAVAIHEVESMKIAVSIAKTETPKSSIVLLSTASPSYGMFKNFEEKGTLFQSEVTGRIID